MPSGSHRTQELNSKLARCPADYHQNLNSELSQSLLALEASRAELRPAIASALLPASAAAGACLSAAPNSSAVTSLRRLFREFLVALVSSRSDVGSPRRGFRWRTAVEYSSLAASRSPVAYKTRPRS